MLSLFLWSHLRSKRWLWLILPITFSVLLAGCADHPVPDLAKTAEPETEPTKKVSPKRDSQPGPRPTKHPPSRTLPTKAIPKRPSKQEVAKQEWKKIVPQMLRADRQRQAVVKKHMAQLRSDACLLVTSEGFEAFIDEALSLNSKAMSLQSQSEHRYWLKDLFTTYVFPVNDFKRLIEQRSRAIESALAQIDNETLIAIKADVDLDPTKIRCGRIDIAALNAHLDGLIADVHDTVNESIAKSVASFIAETASFEVGRQVARSAMEDESGNVSVFGKLFSIGVGLAATEITRSVSNELLQTRETIRTDLKSASDRLLVHFSIDGKISNELAAASSRHKFAIRSALIKEMELDPKWAASIYR